MDIHLNQYDSMSRADLIATIQRLHRAYQAERHENMRLRDDVVMLQTQVHSQSRAVLRLNREKTRLENEIARMDDKLSKKIAAEVLRETA